MPENGSRYVTWHHYVTIGLTAIGILVGAISGVAYSSSKTDKELLDSSRVNAINIATLQECVRSTREELSRINLKLDRILGDSIGEKVRIHRS